MRLNSTRELLPAPIEHLPPAISHRLDSLGWEQTILTPLHDRGLTYVWQLVRLSLQDFSDVGLSHRNSDVINTFLDLHRLRIGMFFRDDEILALEALTTHSAE